MPCLHKALFVSSNYHQPDTMLTVDKAIKRGDMLVNIPVFVIMFGMWVFIGCMALTGVLPLYFLGIGVIIGPIVAWLYWSFAITIWRIWAFSKVDDVYELKDKAIAGLLIWEDGSFFEKTEIRTTKQRRLIIELEKRFKTKKPKKKFVDDPKIPAQTLVYFSKGSLILNIIIMTASLVVGMYLILNDRNWLIGGLCIAIGIFSIAKDFKRLTTLTPQIIIDTDGITLTDNKFSWLEIATATTVFENRGRDSTSYIVIETSKVSLKEKINDLSMSSREIQHRINIHRGRFLMATTANST
jgi:hypothetical protein